MSSDYNFPGLCCSFYLLFFFCSVVRRFGMIALTREGRRAEGGCYRLIASGLSFRAALRRRRVASCCCCRFRCCCWWCRWYFCHVVVLLSHPATSYQAAVDERRSLIAAVFVSATPSRYSRSAAHSIRTVRVIFGGSLMRKKRVETGNGHRKRKHKNSRLIVETYDVSRKWKQTAK